MATQTLAAMFDTRINAERAVDALRLGVSLEPGAVHIVAADIPETTASQQTGRNAVLVSAIVEHDHASKAIDILGRFGAAEIRSRKTDNEDL